MRNQIVSSTVCPPVLAVAGDRKGGHRLAPGGVPHFGIFSKIADQDDFMKHHSSPWVVFRRPQTDADERDSTLLKRILKDKSRLRFEGLKNLFTAKPALGGRAGGRRER
jgi:hypothetical protein